MKKKDFLKLVRVEIDSIKKNATDEEISNLNFHELEPENIFRCIYGQLTGHCDSDRAKELFRKRYSKLGFDDNDTFLRKKKMGVFNEASVLSAQFTPLEVYITIRGSRNKDVIDYIKGENETLIL